MKAWLIPNVNPVVRAWIFTLTLSVVLLTGAFILHVMDDGCLWLRSMTSYPTRYSVWEGQCMVEVHDGHWITETQWRELSE